MVVIEVIYKNRNNIDLNEFDNFIKEAELYISPINITANEVFKITTQFYIV